MAGDLKLAYAQFEELETFSRFGARFDAATRQLIEHGRRIRACLKQQEFAPLAVPVQISVLLALTAGLFDDIPLARMAEAEQAVCNAAANLPAELVARLDAAEKFSPADRSRMVDLARQALLRFHRKAGSEVA